MGLDKALLMVEADPTLEGYFIYGGENGDLKIKKTKALEPFLLK